MSELIGKAALVTGATGFIGGRLVERLLIEHGVQVRALVRDFRKAAWLSRTTVEMVPGDVTDLESVRRAAAGCHLVFHCAALADPDFDACRQVNVQGTENVIRAALEAGVQRLVHISTMAVHGPHPPDGADEAAPLVRSGAPYADTKLEGEELAWRYHQERGLPLAVIRPTIVYGPRSWRWTVFAVQRIQDNAFALPGRGSGAADVVYVDDLVDALILAAWKSEAVGEAFIISNDELITWHQFYGCYAQMLDKPLVCWPKPLSVALATAMEGIDHGLRSTSRLLPNRLALATVISLKAMRKLTLPFRRLEYWELDLLNNHNRFSIQKARRVLGYVPCFSLQEGMRHTETWLEAQGYLIRPSSTEG